MEVVRECLFEVLVRVAVVLEGKRVCLVLYCVRAEVTKAVKDSSH